MSITIYSSGGALKYTLQAVQASRLHQSLNGECTFELSMPGRLIQNIAIGDEIRLGDLYFTVVRIGKSAQATNTGYTVSCEHISYKLADVIQEAAHFSGSPDAVLSEILSGTGFSPGTVGPSPPGAGAHRRRASTAPSPLTARTRCGRATGWARASRRAPSTGLPGIRPAPCREA